MIKSFHILFLLVLISLSAVSQEVYQHVSDKNIYEFVDELANEGIVEINSVVKPYSRMFIAEKLAEAKKEPEKLNKRQQKELDFYLLEYKLEVDSFPDYNRKFDIFERIKTFPHHSIPLPSHTRINFLRLQQNPSGVPNIFLREMKISIIAGVVLKPLPMWVNTGAFMPT
ncbi:MAG: hypothetical protein R2750_12005 [Bacteroidales bacterium]